MTKTKSILIIIFSLICLGVGLLSPYVFVNINEQKVIDNQLDITSPENSEVNIGYVSPEMVVPDYPSNDYRVEVKEDYNLELWILSSRDDGTTVFSRNSIIDRSVAYLLHDYKLTNFRVIDEYSLFKGNELVSVQEYCALWAMSPYEFEGQYGDWANLDFDFFVNYQTADGQTLDINELDSGTHLSNIVVNSYELYTDQELKDFGLYEYYLSYKNTLNCYILKNINVTFVF